MQFYRNGITRRRNSIKSAFSAEPVSVYATINRRNKNQLKHYQSFFHFSFSCSLKAKQIPLFKKKIVYWILHTARSRIQPYVQSDALKLRLEISLRLHLDIQLAWPVNYFLSISFQFLLGSHLALEWLCSSLEVN